jgi:hypothetical protein
MDVQVRHCRSECGHRTPEPDPLSSSVARLTLPIWTKASEIISKKNFRMEVPLTDEIKPAHGAFSVAA